MDGAGYIALAALILLLLPVVTLPWEGYRVPDGLYAALAAAGLAAAGLENGAGAAARAAAIGLGSLVIVAGIATVIRVFLNLQVLTSGHIKLLSAGSVWLGLGGALAMVSIAFAALLAVAVFQHRRSSRRRPDFAAIAALAILGVGIQQAIAEKEATTAAVSNAIK